MANLTKQILLRLDGWRALLGGVGGHKDKMSSASPSGVPVITDQELGQLYYGDGLAASVADLLPEDMTKAGFEVPGDDGRLYKGFQRLGGESAMRRALSYTRLYGGALVLMDIEGAGPYDTPYDPESGRRVRALRVYPRTRVDLSSMERVSLPESPYFEDYEYFSIRKVNGGTFRVHRSRCLVFKSAIEVDPTLTGFTAEQKYWGMSVMPRCWSELAALGTFARGLANLGQELSVGKYRLANLEQLVAEGDYKSINQRMEAIDMQKSVVNGVFLGAGEDYTRESVSLGGAEGLLDKFMLLLCASSRYPMTKLFGRSAAGMNATGEGDQDNHYDRVTSLQKSQLLPPLLYLMRCLNYELKVVEDASMEIAFNSLYTTDPQGEAATRKIIADTDATYANLGVLSADEIRRNRFQGGYSADTSVEDDGLPDLGQED